MATHILNKLTSNKLVQNVGWMGAAEIMARVSRLFTAVVLARVLTPVEFGIIAIAMTTYDFIVVATRNGAGAKIIQASDEELQDVCNTVNRVNWVISCGLFVLQCLIAYPVAMFYGEENIAYLIMALACIYLIQPIVMVRVYLIQRSNKLKYTGLAFGCGITIDNIASAILALSGFGVWSVVYPKILVAVLWVIFHLYIHPWKSTGGINKKYFKEIVHFAKNVLGTEFLKVYRNNVDRLLIGHFLGLEILGVYYFAVNAALGITLSLISAFNTAFYPHLCSLQREKDTFYPRYIKALKMIAFGSILLIGSQSVLTQFYVPLVFGEQWIDSIPLVMIMVLSAIPRPLAEVTGQMFRAISKPQVEFKWNIIFSCVFTVSIYIGLQQDIMGMAYAVLITHMVMIPIYVVWASIFYLPDNRKNNSLMTSFNGFSNVCLNTIDRFGGETIIYLSSIMLYQSL